MAELITCGMLCIGNVAFRYGDYVTWKSQTGRDIFLRFSLCYWFMTILTLLCIPENKEV